MSSSVVTSAFNSNCCYTSVVSYRTVRAPCHPSQSQSHSLGISCCKSLFKVQVKLNRTLSYEILTCSQAKERFSQQSQYYPVIAAERIQVLLEQLSKQVRVYRCTDRATTFSTSIITHTTSHTHHKPARNVLKIIENVCTVPYQH